MSDDKPRAWTKEEVREQILAHIRLMVNYWAQQGRSGGLDNHAPGEDVYQAVASGVAFSILTMIDGCAMDICALDLKLSPHPSDRAYNKSQGDNWYKAGMVINDDMMLHDMFYVKKNEEK
jgi:hypothetical protein